MSYLDDSWFERAFEALQETLRVDKRMKKDMLDFLFAEGFWDSEKLSWENGMTRFDGCLNRNKTDTNFKVSELWALMKRFGRHHLFLAMAEDLGYEVRLKPTEERRQELAARTLDYLERLDSAAIALRADYERMFYGTVHEPQSRPHGGPRPSFSRGDRAP